MTLSRTLLTFGLALLCSTSAWSKLPPLTTDHSRIVDPSGNPVILKGCNLGNWLILEPWMLGGCIQDDGKEYHDQADLLRVFTERFGREKCDQLMNLYRAGYIAPRDFQQIKSFGFNLVRVPFDYRLLQEDTPPYALKSDAFQWLDRALQMAEDADLYVILDLHGAPGGQSKEAHTGESNQNLLWSSDSNLARTVQIWKAVADHCKDRPNIAAYDLLNEPYGDSRTDLRPDLAALMPKIYAAIRSTGDKHTIFFPGVLGGGIGFYGNVSSAGMQNVGFTEHFYPGLFGDKTATESHARVLSQELPAKNAYLQQIDAPYFVGEFNSVLQSVSANEMNRAYFDRFAQFGWAATMWSYKLLTTHGGAEASAWYLITNKDPIAPLDIHQSSFEEFAAAFKNLATMNLAINQPMVDALNAPTPAPLYLTTYPALPLPRKSLTKSDPGGWTSIDIGNALPGSTTTESDGTIAITAGGSDIFSKRDSFRFVHQTGTPTTDFTAQITSFLDSHVYAKAGVMARWGNDADSAMAMVNVFPNGNISLCSRSAPGESATETTLRNEVELPVELRLKITDGRATGMYRSPSSDWKIIGSAAVPTNLTFQMGLAVCSHVDTALTVAKFQLGPNPVATHKAAAPDLKDSLLKNGSFESAGDGNDQAANWNRWGDWMNREDSWTPTHSGKALMAYHHWQIEKADSSGLFQDVDVKAGQRYTFSVFAQHDDPKSANDADTVELRMESVKPDGPVTLNTETYKPSTLPTGEKWKLLTISGTALTDKLRVLIVTSPSPTTPRGGSIKFDDALLITANSGK